VFSLKDEKELNILTTDELILLYFETISEAKNLHIKVDGGGPYESYKIKENITKQYQNQAIKIIQLLKKYKINTNYFYLRYKYIKLKYFIDN